jgi:hypothetical protein
MLVITAHGLPLGWRRKNYMTLMTRKMLRAKQRQIMALSLALSVVYLLPMPVDACGQKNSRSESTVEELLVRFDGVSWQVVDRYVLAGEHEGTGLPISGLRVDFSSGEAKIISSEPLEEGLAVSAHELAPDGQLVSHRIPVPATLVPVRIPARGPWGQLQVWAQGAAAGTIDLEFAAFENGASSSLPPYTTETIIENGPAANRVDIVFLGDGYRIADMDKYDRDVRAMSDYLLDTPPFSEYRRMFNIHKVNVISEQSGIDHPERNLFRDTALDLTFAYGGIPQAVYLPLESEYKVYQAAALVPQADAIIVLANDPQFGGSSGPLHNFVVVTTNPQSRDLLVHELGHSLGFLADESDGWQAPPLREPTQVNVTLQPTVDGLRRVGKWDYWIGASPSAAIGLFQGAMGSRSGVYRPSPTCKMRTLTAAFCPVCAEQIIKRLYAYVRPIEMAAPPAGTVETTPSDTVVFAVTPFQPTNHSLVIRWMLDGVVVDHEGAVLILSRKDLTPGPHTITVVVSDPTPLVRRDPTGRLSSSRSWTIML